MNLTYREFKRKKNPDKRRVIISAGNDLQLSDMLDN
jgi:hypothetical protein